jgi:hypothetical protein
MKFEKIENVALAFTAVFSIILGGTAVVSIVMLAGLLSEFAVVPLHAQTTPAVELQAAMTKEQVEGDLKTAMAAYQKIAADKSAPRDVRAKALLHLAGCYEKQGQQAQNVYRQIVRDYADQPAAAQARNRLAALKQDDHPAAPATMTQRQIEKAGRGAAITRCCWVRPNPRACQPIYSLPSRPTGWGSQSKGRPSSRGYCW